MDLIKKSASVTENDYKRVTLLFFKEIKVLQYWCAYTATEKYDSHVKAIFWEDEYYKWDIEFRHKKLPSEHVSWVRCFSEKNRMLIDNWIKLKNALE